MVKESKDNRMMETFETIESGVRSYSRSWPAVFEKAKGHTLWDTEGKEYIDFFAGAGTLNYGHNDKEMQEKLIEYIKNDGIIHSLDMGTVARKNFLEQFQSVILKPRNLDYKIMFPGPTGTNTVESALKIARKITGRETVINFTNAFHGMTLGALSVTGNIFKRQGAGVPLNHAVTMPFDDYIKSHDSIMYLERFLRDGGSGVSKPAAIILETVQGEGGVHTASIEWIKKVDQLCKRHNILLIVDDVQAGNGRTGTFFSFERAGIYPDIVCLSKSIGGFGLPMAITLIKPEYDRWAPGEHNGTFRGNNMAFIAATEALNYWKDGSFEQSIREKSEYLKREIYRLVETYPQLQGEIRGRGLMLGLVVNKEGLAEAISQEAFNNGLIIETSGPDDDVLKFLPPLITNFEGLSQGIERLEKSISQVLNNQ